MARKRIHARCASPAAETEARVCRSAALALVILGMWSAATISRIVIPAPVQAQSRVDEYKLKAAFIFHFAQLTDWPESVHSENQNELDICTLGSDPFDGDLESIVGGKTIGTRTLRIRHVKQAAEAKTCQIVFVASGEMRLLPELLYQLGNAPVMTVGEADGFIQRGGMVSFCEEGDKMRFEINLTPADRAGLKISSRLIVLAKNVLGSREPR